MSREIESAFYRMNDRRLVNLSNEELQSLFELRAAKIKLDPKGFWDCNKTVYWHSMIPLLMDLYEIMLEIQSRYPKEEITRYPNAFDLLPVPAKWILQTEPE